MARGAPNGMAALPKTRAALEYARELHSGQSRKDGGGAFILHPREVTRLLYGAGAPDHVIAAGALHDVIEKTPAVAADLSKRFGSRVVTLVLAVTENKEIAGYTARKAALRDQVAEAGEEALMLFAADKVSKVRELRRAGGESRLRKRRLVHYRHCLTLLQRRLPDSPLVAQLHIELAGLARDSGELAHAGIL
jgi:(p)ppGpp synthase/HD superfamily hydrolase